MTLNNLSLEKQFAGERFLKIIMDLGAKVLLLLLFISICSLLLGFLKDIFKGFGYVRCFY